MHADPLIAQYEAWAYPQPIADLAAYAAAGGRDLSDPGRMRRKLWPRPIEPATLDILVAGCGANQAAILAHANPQHRVVGIDLSGQALAHHARLKQRHGLDNLELHQVAVEDAARLGRRFDYIVSTGVLHHLADPAAGLTALRESLAPHGTISVMLYGQHRRAGIYMVQEALRTLGIARDAAGVAFARDTVARLPAWHSARPYLDSAPDLHYDAGLVDTLLNARDRAYTVPQIMDLVRGTGLAFQGWLDGLHYSPAAAFPAGSPMHDRIYDLPPEQQWHIVDLLLQLAGAHRFLLCHPEREKGAALVADLRDCVPHLHPDLTVTLNADGSAQLKREWHSISLDADTYARFQLIDGRKTFRAILAGLDQGRQDFLCAVFSQLTEWDHLFCELPLHTPPQPGGIHQ